MSIDWRAVLRAARRHLQGAPPTALPSQKTRWGWIRAALAFQPAHSVHSQGEDASVAGGMNYRQRQHDSYRLPSEDTTPAEHDRTPSPCTRDSVVHPNFKHGIELLASRRYQEAITTLSSVLDAAPDHALALASRAAAYRMLGDDGPAMQDASRAIAVQPDLAWAYATRGALHRLQKNYVEALADLDRAIQLAADYEWCIAGRGETYRSMGELERALEDLNRALDLNPRNDWALMSRCATYLDAHQDELALTAFREAVNAHPDGDWALDQSELTYRLMGKDLTRFLHDLEADA